MVRALEEETAADDYAATLDARECRLIIRDHDEEADVDLDLDNLRAEVAVIVQYNCIDFDTLEIEPFDFDEDKAREVIEEDPLSIEVRTGWHSPGPCSTPEEYKILLCTGGPAVQIIGDLNEHLEPQTATIQGQNWFTPWVSYTETTADEDEALLTYARQFYFGG